MKILVLNSGSSSLKFQLFRKDDLQPVATGLLENIGQPSSAVRYQGCGGGEIHQAREMADHQQALAIMFTLLKEQGCLTDMAELAAIGHRVAHGGEDFQAPVRVDEQVMEAIAALNPLAPLHNPANLTGIRLAHALASQVPQVAVFDTAFHQSMPPHAAIYALPYELYEEERVRRYGFHGTSHHYVAQQAARYLGRDLDQLKLISLHLGNGASACAIGHGHSLDTSMGMTPLEGLVMGSRSGDMDPAILFYLARQTGMAMEELEDLVNRRSGLVGICGDNDMRTIIHRAEQGDERAGLALAISCYRLKKYIGAYLAVLNGADAVIFTGGIGENAAQVRWQSCQELDNLGILLDPQKNSRRSRQIFEIQATESQVKVLVIPTNEELAIASQTRALICGHEQ